MPEGAGEYRPQPAGAPHKGTEGSGSTRNSGGIGAVVKRVREMLQFGTAKPETARQPTPAQLDRLQTMQTALTDPQSHFNRLGKDCDFDTRLRAYFSSSDNNNRNQ